MFIKRWVNWFVPDSLRADEQLYIRARSNVGVSIALGIAAIIYGGLYSIMHHPGGTAAIFIIVGLMVLPAPFIMRFTGSVNLAGNLATSGMLLIQIYLSFTSNGIYGHNTSWFATVPVLATLLLGFGAGLVYGGISVAVIAGFYIMHRSGFAFDTIPLTPTEDLTFRFIVFVGLVAIIMAMTLLFEGLKKSAFRRSTLAFDQLKEAFENISHNAEVLSAYSAELITSGEIIEKNAGDSAGKMVQMVEGAEGISRKIHALADSIEQIRTGVQEISKNTGEAAGVSDNAVTLVESINKMVEKMDLNNKEVGEMTILITDIAFQTNLLALNAAIEAARAGEAGRGFAVVAGAVRNLSLEASEAASKISDKIKNVQEDTDAAIENIRHVNDTIYKFHDLMNIIAAAVGEQTGTLTQMSQHAGEAANETTRIAQSSQAVSKDAESTSNGIGDILAASRELYQLAETLEKLAQLDDA